MEVCSIVSDISIVSTTPAALVVISSVNGSPAVCTVKTESVSTIPPELVDV